MYKLQHIPLHAWLPIMYPYYYKTYGQCDPNKTDFMPSKAGTTTKYLVKKADKRDLYIAKLAANANTYLLVFCFTNIYHRCTLFCTVCPA